MNAIKKEDILVKLDLSARTREGAIEELVKYASDSGAIPSGDASTLVEAVLERESFGSTAPGGGIAFPRAANEIVRGCTVVIGRSSKGFTFPSLDGLDVHFVVLGLCDGEHKGEYLDLVEALATVFKREHVWEEAMRAADGAALMKAISAAWSMIEV